MISDKNNRTLGSIISLINMLISIVIGIFFAPLQIKYLGSEEYGIYTLAISIISYMSIFDLGLGNALIRFSSRIRAKGEDESGLIGTFLIFYSVISFIVAIVGFLCLINIDYFFTSLTSGENSILKTIFLLMLINTTISFPASVFSSVIRSHEKFIFSNLLTTLQNIMNYTIMIVLLLIGYKSVAMTLVSLISNIIITTINVLYCLFKLKIKIRIKKFDTHFYREIIVYSLFIFINILVDQLYSSTDKIILGKYCGSIAVAVYGVGVTFSSYFTLFSTSISSVFLPHISKISVEKDGYKKLSNLFNNVGRKQLIILCFICIGFMVFGKEFIQQWVGYDYRDAYYIALIIMVPSLIPLSQNLGISILQAYNKHKVRSMMYLFIAILNVIISIPLAKRYGGIGAAIGTAVGTILGQILFMNIYYKNAMKININDYWKTFLQILIKYIPLYFVFNIIDMLIGYGLVKLVIKIIISSIVGMIYCYFIILNNEEKKLIKIRV